MGSADTTSLRTARKVFTRNRICDAAKEVFLREGYGSATIEQIARAAGTRRSTVYTHFRDKEGILSAVMEAFLEQVVKLVRELPGPGPTRGQIETWILRFAELAREERAPTIVIIEGGSAGEAPEVMHRFGAEMVKAFAEKIPAFNVNEYAPEDKTLAVARIYAVLRELGWALAQSVADDQPESPGLLIAGEILHRLIHDRTL